MKKRKWKYIYGPVPSWRLGSSLGIDPISGKGKICSFDCVYCQVGRTKKMTARRKNYVSVANIMNEINSLPKVSIDYITFAGAGEPTLAKNLDKMIIAIRNIRKEKIAVITNSSIIHLKEVRNALCLSDFVLLKMDACSESSLKEINRPVYGIKIKNIINGLIKFRAEFSKKLAIQVMFVDKNKDLAKDLAVLIKTVKPDEIQINTPLRPCAVTPLTKADIVKIKNEFVRICAHSGIKVISVYDSIEKKEVKPISSPQTIRRRGKPI
ncbi:MAG: hypothetical protein A2539_09720 [Elusimicrobia bacterium RIFOXYD2_FULL_34_15]|nr:MAG: hypothetical protein A2539_09720 [Elusimicrobia bacterium RIFOXYD2_FULL_34_15]